jgi:titin
MANLVKSTLRSFLASRGASSSFAALVFLGLLSHGSAGTKVPSPDNLVATPASTSRIGLRWSAPASGGLPIQNYRVFRGATASNLSQVATVTQPAYTDASGSPATRYYYGVEAADTSGNVSLMSAIVPATTPRPPAAPAGFSAAAVSSTKIGLKWSTAGSGGLPVSYYHVFRGSSASNLSQVAIVGQTSYTDASVNPAAIYYYAVQTADTGADLSPMSAIVPAKTQAPAAPTNLVATPASTSKIGLTWSAPANGGLPIQNYRVFRGATSSNLSQVATVAQPAYTDASGSPATRYYYGVEAADTSGNVSSMSAIVPVSTPRPPAAPANLVATPASTSSIGLTWSAAASGGLPVQNYHVYRGTTASNLSQLAIVSQTSYTDSTVTAAAKYYYAVAAADTAADLSPMSAIVTATVPSVPSAPTGLLATPVSTTKTSLTWSVPASRGLPIQNYRVFRGTTGSNLSQVATVAQPAYTDASGSPATRYYYGVEAADTSGNVSLMSAIVPFTTPRTPAAPANLVVTAAATSRIGLTWSAAASGGLPVQYYQVFRGSSASNLSQLAVVTQTSYTDTSVNPAVTYYYAVQAVDTRGKQTYSQTVQDSWPR